MCGARFLKIQILLLFVFIVGLINQHSKAAEIRLESCEEGHCTFALEGEILKGDARMFFQSRLNSIVDGKLLGVTFIRLNSDGGDMNEAIDLARDVQMFNVITVVKPGNRCNSACVIVLAAGATRIPGGKIGIHRPYNTSNLSQEEAKTMYDTAKKAVLPILETSGVSSRLWDLIVSTPSESIKFLTTTEKIELGLKGDSPAYGEYTDGVLAERYKISKAELFARKNKIKEYCEELDNVDDFGLCAERIYRTGVP